MYAPEGVSYQFLKRMVLGKISADYASIVHISCHPGMRLDSFYTSTFALSSHGVWLEWIRTIMGMAAWTISFVNSLPATTLCADPSHSQ
jgi:hypothetical protein